MVESHFELVSYNNRNYKSQQYRGCLTKQCPRTIVLSTTHSRPAGAAAAHPAHKKTRQKTKIPRPQQYVICSPIPTNISIAINKHRIRPPNMNNPPRGQYIRSNQITNVSFLLASPRPRLLYHSAVCRFCCLQIFVTAACGHA